MERSVIVPGEILDKLREGITEGDIVGFRQNVGDLCASPGFWHMDLRLDEFSSLGREYCRKLTTWACQDSFAPGSSIRVRDDVNLVRDPGRISCEQPIDGLSDDRRRFAECDDQDVSA